MYLYLQARHKETGNMAALKQVDIANEEELEDFAVEIDILHDCKHKNVVGLHEAFLFNDKLWVSCEEYYIYTRKMYDWEINNHYWVIKSLLGN